MPFVYYAAYNKHRYPGLPGGEFALTRILHWAGFDLSAADPESGNTALHMFASTKVPPFSNARAIEFLLRNGADPSVANRNGDTPLIYMSASVKWTDELTRSFVLLFNDDRTDPWAKADDGSDALSLLIQHDTMAPSEERQAIVAEMERIALQAVVQQGQPRKPIRL